jgi:hypothetical protein
MGCLPSMMANSKRKPAMVLIINQSKAVLKVHTILCKNSLTSGSILSEQFI